MLTKTLKINLFLFLTGISIITTYAQKIDLSTYDVVWTSPSRNSSESMPCGGGDIGLNVWVENGDLLFYLAKSGTFDENNTLLKLGRVRLQLSPNPFVGGTFKQTLKLQEGYVEVEGKNNDNKAKVKLWVDVFRPVVHVEVQATKPTKTKASYESWRYQDRITKGKENNANSYKWAPPGEVRTRKDVIDFEGNAVNFYHANEDSTVFDVTVKQQGMEAVKDELFNPLKGRLFGGRMEGTNMEAKGVVDGRYRDTPFRAWELESKQATKKQELLLYLYSGQNISKENLQSKLKTALHEAKQVEDAEQQTRQWWQDFWHKSYIQVKPTQQDTADVDWQMGRNYQLFRYMLACNAYGAYPTKFNGGLFTYDPALVDSHMKFTPDFRNWGGGTHTAQNQRLVYWPLLRSGDVELMKPQFDFYLQLLNNAELRSKVYWKHGGAAFTEQVENFGLPNPAEYEWKRPADYDKGMQYNAWLEYEWDTVLEFCMMILESHFYQAKDIHTYLPLIESCLQFFDEHYQYLARQRGRKTLDGEGHLVLYPGSAAETYKMAYNANSTISALQEVTETLLALPETYLTAEKRAHWQTFLKRIPPLSFREIKGHTMIAPAKVWERINNTESPQLYPVFPWSIYGIGRQGLDTAINTYRYDPDAVKFRSHIGWKQDNIFAARLGLTDEALRLNRLKLKNSGRRFPAFWGPGFDWVPDHNWGGAGMIGLQEMLLQTDGKKIYMLPVWPKNIDVTFKLHAPYNTTVYCELKNGAIKELKVFPESRRKDIVVMVSP